jgi:OmpA-OmpF porin, OOP family
MKLKTLSLSLAMIAGLSACSLGAQKSSYHNVGPEVYNNPRTAAMEANNIPAFLDPRRAWKPEGIVMTRRALQEVQIGVPKQQMYTILGEPHFNEGLGGNRFWRYIIKVRDGNGPIVQCNLTIDWSDKAERLHSQVAGLYYQNPACPPGAEEPVMAKAAPVVQAAPVEIIREVPREVVREVIKEVRVEVPREVIKEVRVDVPRDVVREVVREVRVNVPAPAPAAPSMMQGNAAVEVLFENNKSTLESILPASRRRLDEFAQTLRGSSQVNSLLATGYADRRGSDDENQRLANDRSNTVLAYLMRTVGNPVAGTQSQTRISNDSVVSCPGIPEGPALIACLQPNRRVTVQATTLTQQR